MIEQTRRQILPKNHILVNKKMETRIRILQKTPRNLAVVRSEIAIKRRKIDSIDNRLEREPHYDELDALEYLESYLRAAVFRESKEGIDYYLNLKSSLIQ